MDNVIEVKLLNKWQNKKLLEIDLRSVLANLLLNDFVVEIDGYKYDISFCKALNGDITFINSIFPSPFIASHEIIDKAFREGRWFIVTDEDLSEDEKEKHREYMRKVKEREYSGAMEKAYKVMKEKGILLDIDKFGSYFDKNDLVDDYCKSSKDAPKMPLNKLLDKAVEIAIKYHSNQFDKGGNMYILHPLAVMNLIKEDNYFFNLSCKIVAVLHDIIEDTSVTKEMLLDLGFPKSIVNAIDLLTKKEGQSKDDYFKEIKNNPIARVVKLADLTHNMDISRIKNPKEKDFKRVEVYKERYEYLKE